jgi:hypothetical protein
MCISFAVLPAWAGQEQDESPPMDKNNPANLKTITATTYSMNAYPGESHLDGQWECSIVGSDGKVYFGDSSHDSNTAAMYCQYDPTTAQVHVLVQNMDVPLGEQAAVAAKTHAPQGKLHVPEIEINGYIYSGTYYGYAGSTYPGGYAFRYKLGSYEANSVAQIDNMGISYPGGEQYNSPAYDAVNNKFYFNTTRMNPDATGSNKVNTGMPYSYFYEFCDGSGNLWTTDSGTLYKLDANTNNYHNMGSLPATHDPNNPSLPGTGYSPYSCFYFGAKPTDANGVLQNNLYVFQQGYDGDLYELNAVNASITKLAHIGLGGLDMCMGGHTVYWLQSATPYGTVYTDPVTHQQTTYTSDAKAQDQHLMSINILDPNHAIVDWGRVIDQSGRTPWRCEGMSADANGHVYMTGDWHLLRDPNTGVVLQSEHPNTVIRANDNSPGSYWDYTNDSPWRGQFFAVVNAPEPMSLALLLAGGMMILRRRR